MNKNIKAVVLDLDGTVLNSKHKVSDLTKETLQKLSASGIRVILASARSIHSVLNIANAVGLAQLPMIGGNGSIIASSKDNILYRNSIKQQDLEKIMPVFKRYIYEKDLNKRVTIHLYSGFEWLVPVYNETVDDEVRAIGFSPDFIGEDVFARHDIEKIMCVMQPDFVQILSNEIREKSQNFQLVRSKPQALEVTTAGVSKLSGVFNYAKIFGLQLSEFIAMGDGDNDAELLAQCGYGVAMENGSELAKKSAKSVTLSNDNDGVAVFLKDYFAIN